MLCSTEYGLTLCSSALTPSLFRTPSLETTLLFRLDSGVVQLCVQADVLLCSTLTRSSTYELSKGQLGGRPAVQVRALSWATCLLCLQHQDTVVTRIDANALACHVGMCWYRWAVSCVKEYSVRALTPIATAGSYWLLVPASACGLPTLSTAKCCLLSCKCAPFMSVGVHLLCLSSNPL